MSYGNRGMALEQLINYTNRIYYQRGMAVINKRPTPVKIVKTKGTRVLSAYLEAPSTVDYEGCYQGHSLQFEAKATKIRTSFPLKNFHEHQVQHMMSCDRAGAITFTIVEFTSLHKIFYLPGQMLFMAWDMAKAGRKHSIPLDDFERECYEVKSSRGVPLDYLAVVDEYVKQHQHA